MYICINANVLFFNYLQSHLCDFTLVFVLNQYLKKLPNIAKVFQSKISSKISSVAKYMTKKTFSPKMSILWFTTTQKI